jgi:hypothetical protein
MHAPINIDVPQLPTNEVLYDTAKGWMAGPQQAPVSATECTYYFRASPQRPRRFLAPKTAIGRSYSAGIRGTYVVGSEAWFGCVGSYLVGTGLRFRNRSRAEFCTLPSKSPVEDASTLGHTALGLLRIKH